MFSIEKARLECVVAFTSRVEALYREALAIEDRHKKELAEAMAKANTAELKKIKEEREKEEKKKKKRSEDAKRAISTQKRYQAEDAVKERKEKEAAEGLAKLPIRAPSRIDGLFSRECSEIWMKVW